VEESFIHSFILVSSRVLYVASFVHRLSYSSLTHQPHMGGNPGVPVRATMELIGIPGPICIPTT
jgi:hypothetical protein